MTKLKLRKEKLLRQLKKEFQNSIQEKLKKQPRQLRRLQKLMLKLKKLWIKQKLHKMPLLRKLLSNPQIKLSHEINK